eukprot:m.176826 g.176826  ORF g.176826 m.176826 type:complete len:68 (-) comp15448_c0_seq21:275-478(-)
MPSIPVDAFQPSLFLMFGSAPLAKRNFATSSYRYLKPQDYYVVVLTHIRNRTPLPYAKGFVQFHFAR